MRAPGCLAYAPRRPRRSRPASAALAMLSVTPCVLAYAPRRPRQSRPACGAIAKLSVTPCVRIRGGGRACCSRGPGGGGGPQHRPANHGGEHVLEDQPGRRGVLGVRVAQHGGVRVAQHGLALDVLRHLGAGEPRPRSARLKEVPGNSAQKDNGLGIMAPRRLSSRPTRGPGKWSGTGTEQARALPNAPCARGPGRPVRCQRHPWPAERPLLCRSDPFSPLHLHPRAAHTWSSWQPSPEGMHAPHAKGKGEGRTYLCCTPDTQGVTGTQWPSPPEVPVFPAAGATPCPGRAARASAAPRSPAPRCPAVAAGAGRACSKTSPRPAAATRDDRQRRRRSQLAPEMPQACGARDGQATAKQGGRSPTAQARSEAPTAWQALKARTQTTPKPPQGVATTAQDYGTAAPRDSLPAAESANP